MRKIKVRNSIYHPRFELDEQHGTLTVPKVCYDSNITSETWYLSMGEFVSRYLAEPIFAHKLLCALNDARRNKAYLTMISPRDRWHEYAQYKVFMHGVRHEPFGELNQEFTNISVHLIACAIDGLRTYLVYDETNKASGETVRYYLAIDQNNEIL